MKTSLQHQTGLKRLIVLFAAFVLSIQFTLAQTGFYVNTSRNEKDGVRSYKSTVNLTTLEFSHKGNITVNDTDTEIKSISSGGFLKIEKTTFGNTRSIYLEGDSDGKIIKEYYEGRTKVDFDPNGEKFLSDVLIEVIRASGIDAENRAIRIYLRGGTGALLEEITQINSNSVKSIYFRKFFAQKGIPNDQLAQAITHVGKAMSSNTEMGRIFRDYADKFVKDDLLAKAYFSAVSKMSSNSETGGVLRTALSYPLSENAQIELLAVARGLSSNSETGSVLRTMASQLIPSEAVLLAYFDVVNGMSSSSEMGSVLRSLIEKSPLSDAQQIELFSSVKRMSSSSEAGSVLRASIKRLSSNLMVQQNFFEAIDRISSTSEKGSVLTEYLIKHKLNPETAKYFFRSTSLLTSSSETGNVLRRSVSQLGNNKSMVDEYLYVASRITSSSEMGSSLRALAKISTDEYVLIGVLDTARRISSSSEMGAVMEAVAQNMPKDNTKIREAYKSTAKSLSSDSEYRRVMDLIF